MKRKILIGFLSFVLILPTLVEAGVSFDPSQTNLLARPLGMSGISLGFADDAGGISINPSALAELEFPQVAAASRKLTMNESQALLLNWAIPTQWGTFGIGLCELSTGNSYYTTLDPATHRIIIDPSREAISFSSSVTTFSYARKLSSDLSLGGNLKLFSQSLTGGLNSKATALGIDLSATYRFNNWLTLATNLQNLIEGNLAWEGSDSDKIGGLFKIGGKVNILGPSAEALYSHEQKLYGGIDLGIPHNTTSSTLWGIGLEYFPQPKLALRAGVGSSGLGLGVGVINGGFRFDYAYAGNPNLPGDNPHYFSLSYVGERVLTIDRKLKRKLPYLKFLFPPDRFLTDQNTIPITAEAWTEKVLDQKRTWTVTAISSTSDAFEVTERENLHQLFLNNKPLDRQGTFETQETLTLGRNVIQLLAYTSPEANFPSEIGSSEIKILQIKPFADTPINYWAIEPISLNVTLGLVTGYPDNTFKPDKGITRAELVTLLVRSLNIPTDTLETHGSTQVFKDVKTNHWAAKYINYGSSAKYVTGYPDGTFKPNKVLSRAEGITILTRYAGLAEISTGTSPFPDLKPDFWANKYIEPAKKAGMLKYLEGKEFKPAEPFTRAEACEVLYRVPAIQNKVNEFWEKGIVSAQPPAAKPAEPSTSGTTTSEAR